MYRLFSTAGLPAKSRFNRWRDALHEQFVPAEQTALGDKPFEGSLHVAAAGDLGVARVDLDAMRTEVDASTIRRHQKHHTLAILVVLKGSNVAEQHGRESRQTAGEMTILDSSRPATLITSDNNSAYFIEVPRSRLEENLGPPSLYSSLTMGRSLAGGQLAVNFIKDLVSRQSEMDEATRTRMGSIALDLVIAAAAERMARETPRAIHGEIVMQRAKAHVEAYLSDPALDPEQVAVASGVSLRRLQELFQERGVQVADWIWERRLRKTAAMLSDPRLIHFAVGQIAYACGFSSQSHFSTRFKNRFRMTPRDYRQWIFSRGSAKSH